MKNNKLVECPECLGTGEIIPVNKRNSSKCPTCDGLGRTTSGRAEAYLDTVKQFNIDDFRYK